MRFARLTRLLPLHRHLAVVGLSGDAALDTVIEEFLRIAHDLPWRQAVGYLDILSEEYLANYGYVQLVGPAPSIIKHLSVRVGIGVWGPHLEYPLDEHEAEELYHVPAAGRRHAGVRQRGRNLDRLGPGRRRTQPALAPPCVAFRGRADRLAVLLDGRGQGGRRARRALVSAVGKLRR